MSATPELACKLSGSNLFLIDSIADDPQFTHPVKVPDGFLGAALPVPHPKAGSLYVKLRTIPRWSMPPASRRRKFPPRPMKPLAPRSEAQPAGRESTRHRRFNTLKRRDSRREKALLRFELRVTQCRAVSLARLVYAAKLLQ